MPPTPDRADVGASAPPSLSVTTVQSQDSGAAVGSFIHEMRRGGNGMLVRICAIAVIGGLLFGYDTGVISGALLFIKGDLHAGTQAQQWIVSSLLLGAILGAVMSGYLADAISRKWVRSKAMSVTTVANWAANFLVAASFLSLGQVITRQGTFFLYAGFGVLALLFFCFRVPETKGRSLEEIQDDLVGHDTASNS